jgi:hypothetical protein
VSFRKWGNGAKQWGKNPSITPFALDMKSQSPQDGDDEDAGLLAAIGLRMAAHTQAQ